MKVMFGVLAVGLLIVGIVVVIGFKMHDGVVETKSFNKSLTFEADKKIEAELKTKITFNKIIINDNLSELDVEIKTDIIPIVAILYSPRKENKHIFYYIPEAEKFIYSEAEPIKKGVYSLHFLYDIDNRTVPVKYDYIVE